VQGNATIFCWDLGHTNSSTSARHGNGLGFIRIWATPPNGLVFWNGAPESLQMISESRSGSLLSWIYKD